MCICTYQSDNRIVRSFIACPSPPPPSCIFFCGERGWEAELRTGRGKSEGGEKRSLPVGLVCNWLPSSLQMTDGKLPDDIAKWVGKPSPNLKVFPDPPSPVPLRVPFTLHRVYFDMLHIACLGSLCHLTATSLETEWRRLRVTYWRESGQV